MNEDIFTLEEFNSFPNNAPFGIGKAINSPEGIFMTSDNIGKELVWAAVKGEGDWCIYVAWAEKGLKYTIREGDKVTSKENVLKLIPCNEEVLKKYRF